MHYQKVRTVFRPFCSKNEILPLADDFFSLACSNLAIFKDKRIARVLFRP